jgi:glycosyltransferase involved in cell wall biosynthesis
MLQRGYAFAATHRMSHARHQACGILGSLRCTSPTKLPNIMRILQIVPTYFPAVRYGGPIRSVHALSTALVGMGHEVHVFTSSMDGEMDLDVPEQERVDLDGVFVRYFRVPFLRRLCWCPSMAAALKSEVAGFDVVHLHSVFLWPTWAAARIARSSGVPFLVSPRGMLGRDVIRRKSRLVKSAWIRLIEARTLRESAALHVTSELEADEISALGFRLPRIFCVPNGVSSPSSYPPLQSGPLAQLPRPYALFLSRISWKKGLDRLIKAWKWVPDLTLVIAGNDEEDYLPKLEALAEREGVKSRLHFTGEVSDEHKWALYEGAMMFILPSYSENFGNVVAEAMAVACPVVVTKEVGLASLVEKTGAGVVADGEPALLAKAINELRCDQPRRRRLGSAGQRAVEDTLSWTAVAVQLTATYSSVMKGHGVRAI